MKIMFNKPFLVGRELEYIKEAVASGKISGDGIFTRNCHRFFETRFNFTKALLTTSCTDALEMAAILIDIKPGDEVILPSYTFVSTANAFVMRGAKLIFADSMDINPNVSAVEIEKLISPRTKAVIVVHYAGIACDMGRIKAICDTNKIFLVEDAAQAIDSYYNGKPLGSFGHFSAFSFHETKNIISGEGGMIVINDEKYIERAEIIREKGTNRSKFFRGEIDKYGWVDIGSSFLPSEIIAAFLYAQLEHLDEIQNKRKVIWNKYFEALQYLGAAGVQLPELPSYATNNAHMFYMVCRSPEERSALISYLKTAGILAVFHYISLHASDFYRSKHDGRILPQCDRYTNCLIRLPLYYELSENDQDYIIESITAFYSNAAVTPVKKITDHKKITEQFN